MKGQLVFIFLTLLHYSFSLTLVKECTIGYRKGLCLSSQDCFSPLNDRWACGDGMVCCIDTGISQRMCLRYHTDWILKEARIPEATHGEDSSYDGPCEGMADSLTEDLDMRIAGGRKALLHQFPPAALVGFKTADGDVVWDCGGTLISYNFIITAQHCLKYGKNVGMLVRLGVRNVKDKTNDSIKDMQEIKVIKKHEFPFKQRQTPDIALLELEHDVETTPAVRPACLSMWNQVEPKAYAIGWGASGPSNYNDGVEKDHLRVTRLKVLPSADCKDYAPAYMKTIGNWLLNPSVLCAGDTNGVNDTCKGDGGGPLLQMVDDLTCMYRVLGITSGGAACQQNPLGIYVNVIYFKSWIETIVWKDQRISDLH